MRVKRWLITQNLGFGFWFWTVEKQKRTVCLTKSTMFLLFPFEAFKQPWMSWRFWRVNKMCLTRVSRSALISSTFLFISKSSSLRRSFWAFQPLSRRCSNIWLEVILLWRTKSLQARGTRFLNSTEEEWTLEAELSSKHSIHNSCCSVAT